MIILLTIMALVSQLIFSTAEYRSNGIQDTSKTWRDIQQDYYMPSPDAFYGYATRYGSMRKASNELYWYIQEMEAQYKHAGYSLIGGGSGFVDINGKEYLMNNRVSEGFGLMVKDGIVTPMTKQQLLLHKLRNLSEDELYYYVMKNYAGVISIKSPNDIGREYCLSVVDPKTYEMKPIGLVIVGGMVRNSDWLPYGNSVNDSYGHIRLGYRVLLDDKALAWNWAADLPNPLYERALIGNSALITLDVKGSNDKTCADTYSYHPRKQLELR